jgi:sugar (pentulose or hexulose) kinase
MRDLLLGIDVGTTYCKAAMVDLGGAAVAHARVFTPWRRVPTGAEIEPERFVDAAASAAREALGRAPDGRVLALGVTSMAETGALLDARGKPVAPAIAWHDERGRPEAEAFARSLGKERFTATTGLPATPLCTLSKYRWLRDNRAGSERAVRWLNVAEWVVRGLGGDEVGDLSLASRTGMLELDGRAPWREALDWAGAPPGLLPEPVPSGTPAGRVRRALEAARGAVLAVAGHDHLCAAVGAGAVREDDVFDSCGTAEAFVRSVPAPFPHERRLRAVASGVTVGWHAIAGRQALLGGFEAGLVLDRLGGNAGAGEDGLPAVEEEDERLRVLEGLAARGKAVLDAIADVAGPASRMVVTGGGARDESALAIKRAALGPFERPRVEEAGARGAALLAGCAAGLFAGVDELPAPAGTPKEALS